MSRSPVPAVSVMGTAAGPAIGRHLDTVFRRLVRGPAATHDAAFLRLLTGEAHPFGNFAILSNPKDLIAARSAIEPLLSCPAPSAVLLPSMESDSQIDGLLTACGFVSHGALPAMAVDIAALPAPALPDGYEFVRIADGADGRVDRTVRRGLRTSSRRGPLLFSSDGRSRHLAGREHTVLRCSQERRHRLHVVVLSRRWSRRNLLRLDDSSRTPQGTWRVRDRRGVALRSSTWLRRRHPAVFGSRVLRVPADGLCGFWRCTDLRETAVVEHRSSGSHERGPART